MAEIAEQWESGAPSGVDGNETGGKPKRKRRAKGKKRTGSRARRKKEDKTGGAAAEGEAGSEIMKEAANRELLTSSERIAQGLVSKAARGSTMCAKLLVDLSAGRKVKPRRGPSGLTYAQELALQPPWKPPVAEDKGSNSPPFAPFA
jgi:hypothetical protein